MGIRWLSSPYRAVVLVALLALMGTTAAGAQEPSSNTGDRPDVSELLDVLRTRGDAPSRTLPGAAGASPVAVSSGGRTTFGATAASDICYEQSSTDPNESLNIDVASISAARDCANDAWIFSAQTHDTWANADVEFVAVWIDIDANDATGCYGVDVALGVWWDDALQSELARFPTCDTDAWFAYGQPPIDFDGAAKELAISVPWYAIGDDDPIRWFLTTQSIGSDVDGAPDTGWRTEQGYANRVDPNDWVKHGTSSGFGNWRGEDIVAFYDDTIPGDFDGNGKADVLQVGESTFPDKLRHGSTGGFGGAEPVPVDDRYRVALGGDFDGDGKDDALFIIPGSGDDYVKRGMSSGLRHDDVSFSRSDVDWYVAGDFDGNGRHDVLQYGLGNGADDIRYGTRGGFSTAHEISIAGQPDLIVPGDYDGDGVHDLLFVVFGNGDDTIRYGRSSGFSKPTTISNIQHPDFVVSGDFDGDDKDDVLLYRWYGDDRIRRGASSGLKVGDAVTLNKRGLPHVGDFDGDGKDDLFLYLPG